MGKIGGEFRWWCGCLVNGFPLRAAIVSVVDSACHDQLIPPLDTAIDVTIDPMALKDRLHLMHLTGSLGVPYQNKCSHALVYFLQPVRLPAICLSLNYTSKEVTVVFQLGGASMTCSSTKLLILTRLVSPAKGMFREVYELVSLFA